MNKKKLVKLATEVLTDIDEDLRSDLVNALEIKLLQRLENRFFNASLYLLDPRKDHKKSKESYLSVKPILDDAINGLLK
tara:strand:- start:315 stop:551 length:237 start_codon:yes stop_codon:yes gene_type:complete